MKKYNVFKINHKIVGEAEQSEQNMITVKIEKETFTLKEKEGTEVDTVIEKLDVDNSISGWESIPVKKEKTLNDPSILTNKITDEVRKTYSVKFIKDVIRKLSLLLNDSYLTAFTSHGLKKVFHPILEEQYGKVSRVRMAAHIKYFVINGMLQETEPGFYEVKKSNLIPKQKKKEENLGILDELNMS